MKHIMSSFCSLSLALCTSLSLHAQPVNPELQDIQRWTVFNRSIEAVNEDGKKAVRSCMESLKTANKPVDV